MYTGIQGYAGLKGVVCGTIGLFSVFSMQSSGFMGSCPVAVRIASGTCRHIRNKVFRV